MLMMMMTISPAADAARFQRGPATFCQWNSQQRLQDIDRRYILNEEKPPPPVYYNGGVQNQGGENRLEYVSMTCGRLTCKIERRSTARVSMLQESVHVFHTQESFCVSMLSSLVYMVEEDNKWLDDLNTL